MRTSGQVPLADLAPDAAALPFGKAAPETEPLVVLQRVLQALGPDLATPADPFGLPGGTALLGEERLRIRLGAVSYTHLTLPTN